MIISDFEGNQEDKEKYEKVVRSIDEYLIQLNRPKDFKLDNPENVLNNLDISFENLIAVLEESNVSNPKNLTVFEFYQRLQYYESKKSSA